MPPPPSQPSGCMAERNCRHGCTHATAGKATALPGLDVLTRSRLARGSPRHSTLPSPIPPVSLHAALDRLSETQRELVRASGANPASSTSRSRSCQPPTPTFPSPFAPPPSLFSLDAAMGRLTETQCQLARVSNANSKNVDIARPSPCQPLLPHPSTPSVFHSPFLPPHLAAYTMLWIDSPSRSSSWHATPKPT